MRDLHSASRYPSCKEKNDMKRFRLSFLHQLISKTFVPRIRPRSVIAKNAHWENTSRTRDRLVDTTCTPPHFQIAPDQETKARTHETSSSKRPSSFATTLPCPKTRRDGKWRSALHARIPNTVRVP